MNSTERLELYRQFIIECTSSSNSAENYSRFSRIDGWIRTRHPQFKGIAEIENVSEAESLFHELESWESMPDERKPSESFNKIGKGQYYNAFLMYVRFLKVLLLLSNRKDNSGQIKTDIDAKFPLQQIFYGAPGTGKSHSIKKYTKGHAVIRTTFHPDSDYSTFVGAYKPTMTKVRKTVVIDKEEKEVKPLEENSEYETRIQYSFVKQALLKAYLGAWKKYAEPTTDEEGRNVVEPQFLVIEEINRGNCAQIFGDLFQLLDRQDNGFSAYPIEADADLQKEIQDAFANEEMYKLANRIEANNAIDDYTSNYGSTLSEDIQQGRVLLLPPNLYIWATMNTSDQSLFPIDSAFKRRWDWKFIKITEGKNEQGNGLDYKIVVRDKEGNACKIKDGESLSWWLFIQRVNEIIASMTMSADKQLGYFFCKAENGEITAETLVNKVIFYLWNDVFKDSGFEDASLFRYETVNDGRTETKDLTFPDFYDENGEEVNTNRLVDFINKVMNWQKPDGQE